MLFENSINSIENISEETALKVKKILDSRMKPEGSLGKLEDISVQIAGITGEIYNTANKRCHIVAAADNGIVEEGVSSCPVEFTRLVSEAMLNKYAAISILCGSNNVDLKVIDIGIKSPVPKKYKNLFDYNVAKGTKNFVLEPAMSGEECKKAIEVGINLIKELKDDYEIFSNGEMGIGNTTTSSAILYALSKEDIDLVVGRGGGLSDSGLLKKKRIIKEAMSKYNLFEESPFEVLRHVGGLDIACMVGMYIGSAKYKKPMLIDGFISIVAALIACEMNPKIKQYLIATHRSEEPGMKVALEMLGLKTMLDMNMRLGEGTGAVLCYPIISSSLEIIKGMKTVDEIYELFN